MYRIIIVVLILLGAFCDAQAQVRGKVYDGDNQSPIEGVNIILEGKPVSISNSNGTFSVDEATNRDTLLFKHLGYHNKSVVIAQDSFLVVTLQNKSVAIDGVTVRGYNTQQKVFSSSGSINILNRRQIDNLSVASPASAINSMPGLYMHNGARNTNRITIRGIGSRSMYTTTKIKAYLNEIPLTSGVGETTLEDLDMDIVDRITVLKGPSSSIYGSSLGGTILYNTGMNNQKGYSVHQESAIGSFSMLKNTSRFSWKGDKSSAMLSYNKLKEEGYRENSDYNRDGITTLLQHQLTEKIGITYLGRYHKLKAYIPSSINEETFRESPDEAADKWASVNGHESYSKFLNGLSFNIDINENVRAKSSLFAKYYHGNEVRFFNILDDDSFTSGTRNLIRWNYNINEVRFTLHGGIEHLFEKYNWKVFETLSQGETGAELSKHKQRRVKQNYFGSLEARWNNLILSTGFNSNKTMYRYNDLSSDSIDLSDSKEFQWITSPRFSLKYRFSDNFMAVASLSHGFSTPSYEETLNAKGYVTGSVKPETGWNKEISIRAKGNKKRFFITVSGYSINVKDLLVTKRIAEDEFQKINAGESLHNGLEVMLRAKWLKTPLITSSLNASYMYADYRFKEFTDAGNDYSGNSLPGIPDHKIFLQLNTNLSFGAYMTANVLRTEAMPMNDGNTKYSEPFSKLDLKAGLQRTLRDRWHINIYGGIKNVTDTDYASMILINAPSYGGPPRYYYPGNPRNYYGGISVSVSF